LFRILRQKEGEREIKMNHRRAHEGEEHKRVKSMDTHNEGRREGTRMKGVSNEMGNFLYDVIILGVTMTPAWGGECPCDASNAPLLPLPGACSCFLIEVKPSNVDSKTCVLPLI
jgi:hypothetical protein